MTPECDAAGGGVRDHCPVCDAAFRGTRLCSRCGADLAPLMRIAVEAWWLRRAAQEALHAGDVQCTFLLASRAEEAQHTPHGSALRLLARWLAAV